MAQLSEGAAAAEATRDAAKHTGFAAGLYEADLRWDRLNVFGRRTSAKDFAAYQQRFRDVLRDLVDPDEIDRTGEIPDAVIAAFRGLKAFALKIPAEYGGVGLTQSDYQDLAVLMGSWCGATTALVSANNSLGASETLKQFGTEEQKQRWWTKLSAGSISGLGLTERDAGCDIWNQKTIAEPVIENGTLVGYRLHGRKQYTTNAPKNDTEFLADILVIDARLPDVIVKGKSRKQFGAFIVDTSRPGIRVAKRNWFMGLRGMYNGDIILDGAFVPECDRVRVRSRKDDNDGLVIALSCITTGRMTLPAGCLGGLKRALHIGRSWATARVQLGKPIGEYQHIADKVVRIASRTLALQALVQLNGILTDEHCDMRMESMASKVLGTEWLSQELRELFYIRGGRGFEKRFSQAGREEPTWSVERMIRDTPINEQFEGDNRVLTLSYGREGSAELIGAGMVMTDKRASFATKVAALARVATLFLKTLNVAGDFGGSPLPSPWARYFKRQSRLLLRDSILTAARFGPTLQDKNQLELMRIARRGMDLFAAATTLAYARHLENVYGNEYAIPLAEWFCRDTLGLGGTNKRIWRLARYLYRGDGAWLEDGIV